MILESQVCILTNTRNRCAFVPASSFHMNSGDLNSGSHTCLHSKSFTPISISSVHSGFPIEINLKQAKKEVERPVRRLLQSDNEWYRP